MRINTERGTHPHYGRSLRPVDRAAFRIWTNRIEAAMNVASKQTKEPTMSKKTETKTPPAYRIFSIVEVEGEKAIWHELGAAWKHKDGKGFNLQFKALPLPGAQVVLREPKQAGTGESAQ
jgi:hypothetical protein